MQFHRATLSDCHEFDGVVVVIDVIRAFTTAAFAFSHGVRDITLVATVEEALQLRDQRPGSRVMGEVGGVKPPAFDYSNSPSELVTQPLRGIRLVQRTTAGTQGVVRSVKAVTLLAASFVVAAATVRFIRGLKPDKVTFVVTGRHSGADGAEDAACADYMEALLKDGNPPAEPYKTAVMHSSAGRGIGHPDRLELPAADADFVLDFNRFDFVMPVRREAGQFVMTSQPA